MTIAVDFDGTIVTHEYPRIGKPIPFAVETLKRLQQDQHLIILWTVREGVLLEEAVEYCRAKGLEFYAVNSNYPEQIEDYAFPRKVTADLYIDDRNLGGLPDWGVIYQMISEGRAFQPVKTDFQATPKKKKSLFARLLGR